MAAPRFALALQDGDLLRLGDTIRAAEAAGIDEIYLRTGDGRFVPDCFGGAELVRAVAGATRLPVYAHLLCEAPDRYLTALLSSGCRGIFVHAEACVHGHRTLHAITGAGLEAGLAVNPATPLTSLNYLLPHAARVLVLAAEYGAKPGTFAKSAPERIRILSENLRYHEYTAQLQAAGGMTAEHAALCVRMGASVCVLDGATLAVQPDALEAAVAAFAAAFETHRHLV